jgi:hypothetical protein
MERPRPRTADELWFAMVAASVALLCMTAEVTAADVTAQSSTLETMFVAQEAFLSESSLAADDSYADETVRLRPPPPSGTPTAINARDADTVAYTRFEFLLTNTNGNIRGTTSSVTTTARPKMDAPRLEGAACPSGRVCDAYQAPVQVSVFASRPVHRYPLTPLGFQIPFGFVTVNYTDATNPASPCALADDCSRPGTRTAQSPCIEDTATTLFTDPSGTVSDVSLLDGELDASCGVERDARGRLYNTVCQSVCCVPCTATGETTYRRKTVHAVGPFCRAFKIGTPIPASDLLATVRLGDNVLSSDTVLTNNHTTLPDYAVARLRSGTALDAARTNSDGTLRVQVLNHTLAVPERVVRAGDVVLVCDYDGRDARQPEQSPPDQGLYNPYVRTSFADLLKTAYESRAHAEVPYDDPLEDDVDLYEAVGGGSVPTRAGLGDGTGRLSWFHVSAQHYEYLRARTQSDIMVAWYNMQPSLLCRNNDTRLANNVQVPGLDTTAEGAADAAAYPTPCQMSARINAYAAAFNASVYTVGVEAAIAQQALAYPDGPPTGLHPFFLLERPNMHVHATNASTYELIYDAIVDSERPVFADIAVDVPDSVLPIASRNAVVRMESAPQCSSVVSANATTASELGASPVLAYNVSAVVAFSVRLVADEAPPLGRLAFAARLECTNSSSQTFYALSYSQPEQGDRRGAYPVDVAAKGGQSAPLTTLGFEFYTLNAKLRSFTGCTVVVFQYDAGAPAATRNVYGTPIDRVPFFCAALIDESTADLAREAVNAYDDDDSDYDALAVVVFVSFVGLLLLCLAVCIGGCVYYCCVASDKKQQ